MLTPSRLAIDVYMVCLKTLYLINQNTAQINNLGLPWYLNIIMQFLKMVSAIKKKKKLLTYCSKYVQTKTAHQTVSNLFKLHAKSCAPTFKQQTV